MDKSFLLFRSTDGGIGNKFLFKVRIVSKFAKNFMGLVFFTLFS